MKSKGKIYILLSIVVLIVLLISIFATKKLTQKNTYNPSKASNNISYYVSNSGNDSNNGLSEANSLLTITKAVALANPGDTIYVSSGNYSNLNISKSGEAGSPIKIVGNSAKISGGTIGIIISGSYIEVSGFEVSGTESHGVILAGKHIVFSNFNIHDNVNENKSGDSCTNGSWGSGLKVEIGAEDINMNNGSTYRNCGEGFATTGGRNITISNVTSHDNFSVNFYIDNSADVTVKNNFSYCTSDSRYYRDGNPAVSFGIGEESYNNWGAELSNLKIFNNISYGCQGISFWGAEVSPGGLVNALIAHNTIINLPANKSSAIYIVDLPNNTNIKIYNNIAQGNISQRSSIVSSNNLNTTSFLTTPTFDSNTFKLASNSDAINAGVSTEVTNDFIGTTRPQGIAPDIGAYEYTESTSATYVPTVAPTTLATSTPTTIATSTATATSTSTASTSTATATSSTATTLATSTPTTKATSTATATSTSTASTSTATATSSTKVNVTSNPTSTSSIISYLTAKPNSTLKPLPETGSSETTFIGLTLGIMVIIGSLLLIF